MVTLGCTSVWRKPLRNNKWGKGGLKVMVVWGGGVLDDFGDGEASRACDSILYNTKEHLWKGKGVEGW